jgi:hypothetical protein
MRIVSSRALLLEILVKSVIIVQGTPKAFSFLMDVFDSLLLPFLVSVCTELTDLLCVKTLMAE